MKDFPSLKEVPFASNTCGNGNPLSYEQWRLHIAKAIQGFNFGPHVGPLVIPGKGSDQNHLHKIQEELVARGWKVEVKNPHQPLARANELVVIMYIRHPKDWTTDI